MKGLRKKKKWKAKNRISCPGQEFGEEGLNLKEGGFCGGWRGGKHGVRKATKGGLKNRGEEIRGGGNRKKRRAGHRSSGSRRRRYLVGKVIADRDKSSSKNGVSGTQTFGRVEKGGLFPVMEDSWK